MKALVSGGAGFIGSNLVDVLVSEGHQVSVVDNLSTGRFENLNPGANFYKVDITSPELFEVIDREKPEIVFHLAAQIDIQQSLRNPVFDAGVNILGTVNLLEACRNTNVKKVIYSSSAAVYGEPLYLGVDEKHPVDPMSYYGISKHVPEHYLKVYAQLYGLDYTVLRYANAYGPRQIAKGEGGVIAIFIDRLLEGNAPMIFGDGEQTRDFIFVQDIVNANLKAAQAGSGEILNVSCAYQTTVNELYKMIKSRMNTDLEPIYQDARKGDILHSYLENKRTKEVLGWEPVHSLEQGLGITIEYYRGEYK